MKRRAASEQQEQGSPSSEHCYLQEHKLGVGPGEAAEFNAAPCKCRLGRNALGTSFGLDGRCRRRPELCDAELQGGEVKIVAPGTGGERGPEVGPGGRRHAFQGLQEELGRLGLQDLLRPLQGGKGQVVLRELGEARQVAVPVPPTELPERLDAVRHSLRGGVRSRCERRPALNSLPSENCNEKQGLHLGEESFEPRALGMERREGHGLVALQEPRVVLPEARASEVKRVGHGHPRQHTHLRRTNEAWACHPQ